MSTKDFVMITKIGTTISCLIENRWWRV